MEGCQELIDSTEVRTYPDSESNYIPGAAICNYVDSDAAHANDMFKDEPGQLLRVDILLARYVDCLLCQSVHNDKNPSVAQCRLLSQVTDEVHRDAIPRL
jgi:hypothetical protein